VVTVTGAAVGAAFGVLSLPEPEQPATASRRSDAAAVAVRRLIRRMLGILVAQRQ
jgi:hypothetical protein